METPEIGSLTAHSPQESQFVGSSSGVFFINTVRQAFFSSSGEFPPPEDTLVGNESTPRTKTQEETPVSQWEYDDSMACVLGQAPPQQLARDLMMVFFKVWHPLFPFLHGPTFLHAMESLYAEQAQNQTHQPSKNKHNSTAWAAIFQCIFHLANLVRPDIELPVECRIQPPISASIHTLLSPLTARHDLLSLQALLASQLYLVATMSLRTASTVGGCMLRSMLHAGLHRCPFRYHELSTSSQQRHLRKRIFWSAYALDRYLSQALGLPLGVQDSDIDVCPPGSPEIHKPLQHLPTPNNRAPPPSQAESEQSKREIPFASYVQSGKLTGEALELFHKSIFVRSISQTSVLVLTTSVHKWWNSLDLPPSPPPQQPPTPSDSLIQTPTIDSTPFNYTPFFTILYQHLLLLLHRPSLSLPNSTPEFASALQSCISAARHILLALKAQTDSNQALFWPGFLSAAWMAGLVLAFACQLGQYGRAKGCLYSSPSPRKNQQRPTHTQTHTFLPYRIKSAQAKVISNTTREISSCLDFLRIMSAQWEPAKHCHRALSLLLRAVSRLDIDSNSTAAATSTTTTATTNVNLITRTCISRLDPPSPGGEGRESESPLNTRKRRKLGPSSPRFESARSPAVDFASAEDSVAGVSRVAEGVSDGLLSIGEVGSGFNTQHDRNWDLSLDLDMNMVDLLQEGNFDSLMDLFGQQYPTF